MAGKESRRQAVETLTEAQGERIFTAMNEVIRAGEEMRRLRAEMISVLADLGWTQERIAQLADMSQPAVSKQMAKRMSDEPRAPIQVSLDQRDSPWLEGRLWGLAEAISETLDDGARCTRCVNALSRGKKRFTPTTTDELRRLVEEDLRLHREELSSGHQVAYDEISRGLDLPSKTVATASASVRRSIARLVQRDLLKG